MLLEFLKFYETYVWYIVPILAKFTFKEDASRKYKGYSAENFSRFLRLCLNAVKSLTFTGRHRNASMRNKCRKVVNSKELLSQVLYGIDGAT
mgnify:CR=1 FL=1